MNRLDRQRLYFLKEDRDRYYKTFLPTIATTWNMFFFRFRIFNDYKVKAVKRLDLALERIKGALILEVKTALIAKSSIGPKARRKSTIWETAHLRSPC